MYINIIHILLLCLETYTCILRTFIFYYKTIKTAINYFLSEYNITH